MVTEQEKFWQGEFGNEYIERNTAGNKLAGVASNTALFSRILRAVNGVESVIEFGANIGLNLRAVKSLLPEIKMAAVEINQKAAAQAKKIGGVEVYESSILQFTPEEQYDFSLIKGVLIHIAPDQLPLIYEKLYSTAKRYICIVEYYNPTPVEISYRGHENKLFKRDFAGEMLDKYTDLKLIDYGFCYHRDNLFPQDDVNWFLLGKNC